MCGAAAVLPGYGWVHKGCTARPRPRFYDCAECLATAAVRSECEPCDPEVAELEAEAVARRPAHVEDLDDAADSGDTPEDPPYTSAAPGVRGLHAELDELRVASAAATDKANSARLRAERAAHECAVASETLSRRVTRSGGSMQDPVAQRAMRMKEELKASTSHEHDRRHHEAALLLEEVGLAEKALSGTKAAAPGAAAAAPAAPEPGVPRWARPNGPAVEREVRHGTRYGQADMSFRDALANADEGSAAGSEGEEDAASLAPAPNPPSEGPAPKRAKGHGSASASASASRPVGGGRAGRGGRGAGGGGRGSGAGGRGSGAGGRGRRGRAGKGRRPGQSKRAWAVLRIDGCRPSPVGGNEYLVVWAGFPEEQASWEPEANLSPQLIEDYAAGSAEGNGPLLVAATAATARATAAHVSRELSAVERDILLDSACPVPKQWQSNTPNAGYFSRTWGLLVFNRSCVQVVDFEELFGSESLSQVVFCLLKLLHDCPTLLDQLTCMAYDDACHLLRFLELRRDVRQYADIVDRVDAGRLAMFVDEAHFNFSHKDDTFCQTRTNPFLYGEVRKGQNGEAAEQSNAWLSRFKLIVRQMTPARYRFFMLCMFWRRNERIVHEFTTCCTAEELRGQCAAHGVASGSGGEDTAVLRRLLRTKLMPPPPALQAAVHCPAVCGVA